MIRNLWGSIRLICGNHEDGEKVYMEPHEASSSKTMISIYGQSTMNMFYACPKYYPENRAEGEPLCRNHISMKEFESMLEHIMGILEQYSPDDVVDLVGEKWKSKKGVEYEVVRQTEKHIDIKCINRSALWKK